MRLMKRRNRGAIQRRSLTGILVWLVMGNAMVQKNGKIETKKIAAPTICAFLTAA